ncbi:MULTISPECIES: 3' terminal RNA ribose 2'-O-methyltransferase Hen1 [unclassified Streptomyces]|uniref:3' terminal RNA ribose 2'-O-methyltransferase Hen1 n=1 Tax=unclassified Streptomyces TaxID=2593676 RepID=UPI0022548ECD|nr:MULTISPECIES: 3' terminal RNA ribose 2'-O-methyltransferase Hen1 [unclassified Streptomyces]MCX4528619.1 3' terminal RNA ribose 2'-O-methyltransferase Hen1 [Streptomyces sp. NBC_01551]MCX4540774.1 3' terminal RNA ribose 2'-O-methyltransferase Hen1 [Streptomyces sp. NBC_01565]
MFLTISTTGTPERPATDLGFLLHKHPDKAQTFSTSHGTAHVFYPEASAERCTAALLLEVDPVALVRRGQGKGRGGAPDAALAQYVNDRPYAASSLLAVALSGVFGSALNGRCTARPELPEQARPLRVEIPALPARGGAELVRGLFGPLGWDRVEVTSVPLDEQFPEWGDSRYVRLVLEGEAKLADALRQLYVLLPVLDDAKHYWVAPDEVDKLLRAGDGWLAAHPENALITSRYLARLGHLTRDAMERLELVRLAEADGREVEEVDNAVDESSDTEEKPVPLAVHRREAILAALRDAGAARVLDLGCGQGQLVQALLGDVSFTEIVGVDVSMRALGFAAKRLRLDRLGERQSERVRLLQGSLAYTDKRLTGYDAAVLSEVIEHLDLPRLPALEYAVFGSARPRTVLVTTPNVEYNVRWESLPAGHVRHGDHRFEWTRAQFRTWAAEVAGRYGYAVAFVPVGDDDPEVGPPTQMAVFTQTGTADSTGTTTSTTTDTPKEGEAA